MVAVASNEANAVPLVYGPRDDCPGCGESLYATEHIQLLDCHLGRERPSWTLYHCPLCNTTFRVYWPSLRLSEERMVSILLAEAGRRARGEVL